MATDTPAAPAVDEALLTLHLERIAAALPRSDATRDVLATFIRTADEADVQAGAEELVADLDRESFDSELKGVAGPVRVHRLGRLR